MHGGNWPTTWAGSCNSWTVLRPPGTSAHTIPPSLPRSGRRGARGLFLAGCGHGWGKLKSRVQTQFLPQITAHSWSWRETGETVCVGPRTCPYHRVPFPPICPFPLGREAGRQRQRVVVFWFRCHRLSCQTLNTCESRHSARDVSPPPPSQSMLPKEGILADAS
jgi:hypothetical protein